MFDLIFAFLINQRMTTERLQAAKMKLPPWLRVVQVIARLMYLRPSLPLRLPLLRKLLEVRVPLLLFNCKLPPISTHHVFLFYYGCSLTVDEPTFEFSKLDMPALSSTMKEGKVVSWLKSEGDKVESGEAIMVVESDKADMDVEAFEDGYIAAIITEEGESALVGTPVALIAANEADIPALKSYASTLGGAAPVAAAATPQAAAPSPKATPKAVAPVSSGSTGDRVVASPLAKKMAQEMGVDISSVVGTGPGGSEFVMENVSVMLLLCTKYHSCIYL